MCFFFFYYYGDPRDLHGLTLSFPTRRSSDLSLGRGLLIAVGMVVLAGPIARLSGVPQLAPEIAVLAIAPLIMGVVNWDDRRQQRDSDFRAEGRIVLVAEVVSRIANTNAAIMLRDLTARL